MPPEPKIVVQEDTTGCGIACAAMLAGKTYHAAKKRAKGLGLFPDDRTLYSDICDLRPLLESYNIRLGKKVPFRNWKEVPSPAIVAIKYRDGVDASSWHFAVFHEGDSGPSVLDPSRRLRCNARTDLGKIRPQWYVPVRAGRGEREP